MSLNVHKFFPLTSIVGAASDSIQRQDGHCQLAAQGSIAFLVLARGVIGPQKDSAVGLPSGVLPVSSAWACGRGRTACPRPFGRPKTGEAKAEIPSPTALR